MAVAERLPADVAAVAAAIANQRAGRRGAPAVRNVLDLLPQHLLQEVVEDARAALAALAAMPPRPRPAGPLRGADVSALGLDLDARFVVVAATDERHGGRCAVWKRGHGVLPLSPDQAVAVTEALGDALAALPLSPQPTETNP